MSRPLLSVYVAVDPARPGDGPRAAHIRLKRALKRIEAPAELAAEVESVLEPPPASPSTLAAFTDGERVETVRLGLPLPVTEPTTGDTAAAYGEPLRAPLCFALDRWRYGVAVVDDEWVRFFEIFAGEIEHRFTESRSTVPGEYDHLEQSKQVTPAFVASRGGAAKDDAARHAGEWTKHLYRRAARRIDRAIGERHIDRLLIAGADAHPKRLVAELPPRAADRVAGLLPAFSGSAPGPELVLAGCREAIEADRDARIRADLDRLEGPSGIGGRGCAIALAEGRLSRLYLSWQIPTMQLERHLQLARERATQVDFVTGERGEQLLRAHLGMVGEKRW